MAKKNGWSSEDIGDLGGTVAIVTGANSGIGYETARALARKGAHVVMACRSVERGEAALAALQQELPGARIDRMALDLSDLDSVRAFAAEFLARDLPLHRLVNNAGVMVPPAGKTAQGFDLQLGTNHMGHFALTGLLLERLLATPGARVVVVASLAHRIGRVDFDDLHFEKKKYRKWRAYGQSKLANLLFAFELQRRFAAAGAGAIAVAAHPGFTHSNLQRHDGLSRRASPLFAQSSEQGALPTLYAVAAPDVAGGDYFGPSGLFEMKGPPKRVAANARARDVEAAARLWQLSEEQTGVRYEALDR